MNNLQLEKPCRKCQIIKPLTEFYTRGRGAKGMLFHSYCKQCTQANKTASLIAKGAKMPGRVRFDEILKIKVKVCSLCRVEKPTNLFNTAFHKNRNETRVRSQCKECEQATARKWREANLEHCREIQRRSNRKRMEQNRLYRQANRGKAADYHAEWRRKNPGKHNEHEAQRRLRIRNASMGEIDKAAIIARDSSTCYMCYQIVPVTEIHLDHVIPLVRGGIHSAENIKVACEPCNLRKHSKTYDELTFV